MQERKSVLLIDKKLNSKDNPRIKYLDDLERGTDEIPKSIFYTLLGKKLIIYQHDTTMPNGLKIENYILNTQMCDKLDKV